MAHSYAEEEDIQCTRCGSDFQVKAWQIVDVAERPDLLQAICRDQIRKAGCPRCGSLEILELPLLVYVPVHGYLIWASAPSSNVSMPRPELLQRLIESLENLPDKMAVVTISYSMLPVLLQAGVEVVERITELHDELWRLDPKSAWQRRIEIAEQVLSLIDPDVLPGTWADWSIELGLAWGNAPKDASGSTIEHAIEATLRARSVLGRDSNSSLWWKSSTNLAAYYVERVCGEQPDNIERAIECQRDALDTLPGFKRPGKRLRLRRGLAVLYRQRTAGDPADHIEQSLVCLQEALEESRLEEEEEWAATQAALGETYWYRVRGNRADNLEQALLHYELASRVHPRTTSPEKWAALQPGICNVLADRICGDRSENLERAIVAAEGALEFVDRERDAALWGALKGDLGHLYWARIAGDRVENIERSICLYQEAIGTFVAQGDKLRSAQAELGLACCLMDRLQGDRSQNVDQAILILQRALDEIHVCGETLIQWVGGVRDLGTAYLLRPRRSLATSTADAITCYERGLARVKRDTAPALWASLMMSLGYAHTLCSLQDPLAADVHRQRAIESYEHALGVFTRASTPRDWARTKLGLAAVLLPERRRSRSHAAGDVDRAIAILEEVEDVFTRHQHPLEWAQIMYYRSYAWLDRAASDGLQCLERAVTYGLAALEVFQPEPLPVLCRRASGHLGDVYMRLGRWSDAANCYQIALEAHERLYGASVLQGSRDAELMEAGDLHRRAAYALARAGRLLDAVVLLEQGIARALGDALGRDASELERVCAMRPDLFRSYELASVRIQHLEAQESALLRRGEGSGILSADLFTKAAEAQEQLRVAVAEIRKLDGHDTFLRQPVAQEVCDAAQPTAALVYLLTVQWGSLALVINATGNKAQVSVEPVWADRLTSSSLLDLLDASHEDPTAPSWFAAYDQQRRQPEVWTSTQERVARLLWNDLMGPVVGTVLSTLDTLQAILVPTGLLGYFPLHAAHDEATGQYAIDLLELSYAPSARALLQARRRAAAASGARLLAICASRKRNGVPPLVHALAEVQAVAALFGPRATLLIDEEATRSRVLSTLPAANIVHFACHGVGRIDNPGQSSLLLDGGERLTLEDLLALRLSRARLATLSACESGIKGVILPDEVVSLPSSLLRAGFAGVISSLWLVDDLSTGMLMERLYYGIEVDGQTPGAALRSAMLWLRDTTNQEKITYFQSNLYRGGPAAAVFLMALGAKAPNARDFAEPRWWSPFFLTGV